MKWAIITKTFKWLNSIKRYNLAPTNMDSMFHIRNVLYNSQHMSLKMKDKETFYTGRNKL